MTKQLASCP